MLSLIIPLQGYTWILPSMMAAEIMMSIWPRVSVGVGGRMIETYEWRGQQLPLLKAELWLGRPIVAQPKGRILVVHSLEAETDYPFWALEMEGVPQMVSLKPEDLHQIAVENTLPQGVYPVGGAHREIAYIPDLSVIEALFVRAPIAV